jgi:hypothetical protein
MGHPWEGKWTATKWPSWYLEVDKFKSNPNDDLWQAAALEAIRRAFPAPNDAPPAVRGVAFAALARNSHGMACRREKGPGFVIPPETGTIFRRFFEIDRKYHAGLYAAQAFTYAHMALDFLPETDELKGAGRRSGPWSGGAVGALVKAYLRAECDHLVAWVLAKAEDGLLRDYVAELLDDADSCVPAFKHLRQYRERWGIEPGSGYTAELAVADAAADQVLQQPPLPDPRVPNLTAKILRDLGYQGVPRF